MWSGIHPASGLSERRVEQVSEQELHTVAVFQDAAGADAALAALTRAGFPLAALSAVAVSSDAVAGLLRRVFGAEPVSLAIPGLGDVLAGGDVVVRLQGEDSGLGSRGVAATATRLGFQPGDGRIYEALLSRGGMLVAVRSTSRAADALAVLHAYGGGNAAIGAWAGRL